MFFFTLLDMQATFLPKSINISDLNKAIFKAKHLWKVCISY